MTAAVRHAGEALGEPAAAIVERIAEGKPVRRTLAPNGRVHVDRALPFLCVCRQQGDAVARGFVRTQASYLVAPVGNDIEPLVCAIVDALADACGACLVLELWAGTEMGGPFRIRATATDRLATTIDALAAALREMTIGDVVVEIVEGPPAPVGETPLVEPAKGGVLAIGLEIPPRYRNTRGIYPFVAQAMTRDIAHALQRGFFEFARVQTPAEPAHFHAMGRRAIVRAVREADHALAQINATFDFLLAITPVNVEAAWEEFSASGRTRAPLLRYRMLEVDPSHVKRELYELPLDRLEDPVLAQLLHDKRRELDRQLSLLEDRDTLRFLHGSLQLYPPVDDALLEEAHALLAHRSAPRDEVRCGAAELVARATAEIAHYQRLHPALAAKVLVRDDIAGLMVSRGDLLVPRGIEIGMSRVDALLQHEIGTHIVTYANGFAQPLRVLAGGLAGYEGLQEGLALLGEYLVGGLDVRRLRTIAARVVAVRMLVEGAALPDVVAELVDTHGFTPRSAFGVAVRVFRGGGLTKDAIYLRGLIELLGYLRSGGDLAPLLVGKLALDQVPLVEELLRRGVLRWPAIEPRWLTAAPERFAGVRAGLRPRELL